MAAPARPKFSVLVDSSLPPFLKFGNHVELKAVVHAGRISGIGRWLVDGIERGIFIHLQGHSLTVECKFEEAWKAWIEVSETLAKGGVA
jgi:hypothetical protein